MVHYRVSLGSIHELRVPATASGNPNDRRFGPTLFAFVVNVGCASDIMARYIGPTCKLCRREGMKLFLKGKRCEANKCRMEAGTAHKAQRPKMAGAKRSTYAIGLRAKQQLKLHYGILEKQFRRYFEEGDRKKGNTANNMMTEVERRLDNVVKRLGVAWSPRHARQMVSHGHVRVNGRKVDIASYQVRPGDKVTFTEKEKVREALKQVLEWNRQRNPTPSWLTFDETTLTGSVMAMPTADEIVMNTIDLQVVVEFLSR